jgi:hypothetical protein
MNLDPHIDRVRHELGIAAAAGGPDAAALADRLTAPLESALRLTLLEALSEAADQITREIAPDAVEVRLRGRSPEFVVSPRHASELPGPALPGDSGDDGGTWRVSLRLPESLRSAVETAAREGGVSVNSWLVRAVQAGLGSGSPQRNSAQTTRSFSGWVH